MVGVKRGLPVDWMNCITWEASMGRRPLTTTRYHKGRPVAQIPNIYKHSETFKKKEWMRSEKRQKMRRVGTEQEMGRVVPK